MATINTRPNKPQTDKDFVLLPSDVYRMKIKRAAAKENRFADALPDGTKPLQIELIWEVTSLTPEQQEAAEEAEQDWVGAGVWQYLNPYYGPVRDGGTSKFQQFIDMLREQGFLEDFDPDAFDPESLVGLEQRVNVLLAPKTMGDNAGKPGNKIVAVLPLKRIKAKAAPKTKADEDLF